MIFCAYFARVYTKFMMNSFVVGRETKADYLFNIFFGTAIITVLGIRALLAVTNYPHLGGDNLHIAHMLWGGLFMLASIVGLLYFHGFRSKFAVATLAGIGFGFFIDELGKFITSDNDYFYRPTAMLIYIAFVLLWALLNRLARYRAVTTQEKAVDAFSKLRDVMLYGLSDRDAPALRTQLVSAGCKPNEADRLLAIANEIAPRFNSNSLWQKMYGLGDKARAVFDGIASSRRTKTIILAIFVVHALVSMVLLMLLVSTRGRFAELVAPPISTPSFIINGLALCLAATMFCIAIGVVNFAQRRSHLVFVWYRRALLITIFGTQVFLFYTNQFQAAFGLALNLLLLAFVNELANYTRPSGVE